MSVNTILSEALWTWADWALNSTNPPDPIPDPMPDPPPAPIVWPVIEVVRSNQSGPRPSGTYVIVEDHITMTPIGSASRGQEVVAGFVASVTDYTCRASFWEVSGDGDNLRKLQQIIEWQASKDMLALSSISAMSAGEVLHMPRLLGEAKWVEEFRLEVTFGVAVDLPEPIGWIESVALTNQIGGP